uniref:Uncharacterized protein n=1 Tax=Globodera rostochiensis TaxID=31243 RepID=A0A914GZZ3_GLORO
MAKIFLCAKVCWFIYAQIVLLHLVHHHQSVNGAYLKVYFDPPGVQYSVTVSTVLDFVLGTYRIIANGLKTKTQPDDRQMIKLNKTKLANLDNVAFTFVRTDGSKAAVTVVHGKQAREEQELTFNYYENGGKLANREHQDVWLFSSKKSPNCPFICQMSDRRKITLINKIMTVPPYIETHGNKSAVEPRYASLQCPHLPAIQSL